MFENGSSAISNSSDLLALKHTLTPTRLPTCLPTKPPPPPLQLQSHISCNVKIITEMVQYMPLMINFELVSAKIKSLLLRLSPRLSYFSHNAICNSLVCLRVTVRDCKPRFGSLWCELSTFVHSSIKDKSEHRINPSLASHPKDRETSCIVRQLRVQQTRLVLPSFGRDIDERAPGLDMTCNIG